MITTSERRQVNNFLGHHGFAQLDEPGALIQQLAYMVEDHGHFREMLAKCEPERRRDMYESLRPHLRFEARPLDSYIAEASAIAEAKQLPRIAADGSFTPFQTREIVSDEQIIANAIGESLKTEVLTLTCIKCTRVEQFSGRTKWLAVKAARGAGWTWDELKGDGREVCPTCPGGKAPALKRFD